MKSWEAELTPVDMQNVTTYILSLQGTTPAEPKPPQGTLAAVPDSTAAN
jgi:cytochrome c oxidase cbb3-type subunit 3